MTKGRLNLEFTVSSFQTLSGKPESLWARRAPVSASSCPPGPVGSYSSLFQAVLGSPGGNNRENGPSECEQRKGFIF